MNPQVKQYDYIDAGFDGFLSRSIDDLVQTTLDSAGPQSTAVRYDSAQVSGMLGDSIQVGLIRLEKTRIVINDGEHDFLLMGEDV